MSSVVWLSVYIVVFIRNVCVVYILQRLQYRLEAAFEQS